MQKAHFKHILTYTQDYLITNSIFKAEHTHLFIKHIDLKEPHSSSTGKTQIYGFLVPWKFLQWPLHNYVNRWNILEEKIELWIKNLQFFAILHLIAYHS